MRRAALALVCGAVLVGGSACGLTGDGASWRVQIDEADAGAPVTFCPVTGQDGTPTGSFVADANAIVVLSIEEEDIHTFNQLGTTSAAVNELFGGEMVFDLGPIGLAYDDGVPVTVFHGGVQSERRLVDGQRKADDEVELRYEYRPACTEVTLGDGSTCTCGTRTLRWRFTEGQ